MDIVNPEVIKFINEVIRPSAEIMRNYKVMVDAAMVTWYADISPNCPNDSSPVVDNRELDGVSRLTGADVNSFVAQMSAYKFALDQSGVAQVTSKPCVRPLEI
jgi:hypothetical protein